MEVARILAVTPNGTVTARTLSSEFPPEGTELSCARLPFSAVVFRVFGPVAHPYLALRPRRPLEASTAAALIGCPVAARS